MASVVVTSGCGTSSPALPVVGTTASGVSDTSAAAGSSVSPATGQGAVGDSVIASQPGTSLAVERVLLAGTAPPLGLGFHLLRPGWMTMILGPASGIRARIAVWLPPEYGQPAYANTRFRVIQLLGGYPGVLSAWFHSTQIVQGYLRARAAHVPPAILVATEVNVAGRTDLECLDGPGHPRVETWITRDVPNFMRAHFRVAGRSGWAVMGYSMGGYCAPYLALAHPDVYAAAVAMEGYLVPSTPSLPQSFLASRSLLVAAARHPAVSLLWETDQRDWESPPSFGVRLRAATQLPTRVTLAVVPGQGHATRVWRQMLPGALTWLLERLRV